MILGVTENMNQIYSITIAQKSSHINQLHQNRRATQLWPLCEAVEPWLYSTTITTCNIHLKFRWTAPPRSLSTMTTCNVIPRFPLSIYSQYRIFIDIYNLWEIRSSSSIYHMELKIGVDQMKTVYNYQSEHLSLNLHNYTSNCHTISRTRQAVTAKHRGLKISRQVLQGNKGKQRNNHSV